MWRHRRLQRDVRRCRSGRRTPGNTHWARASIGLGHLLRLGHTLGSISDERRDVANGVYISAGYSGLIDDYDGGPFYDPTDSVVGNRYYHPTGFVGERS